MKTDPKMKDDGIIKYFNKSLDIYLWEGKRYSVTTEMEVAVIKKKQMELLEIKVLKHLN